MVYFIYRQTNDILDKGKPTVTWGRKANGLEGSIIDFL